MRPPIVLTAGVMTFALSLNLQAGETTNPITPTLQSIEVTHNGQPVTIKRNSDPKATMPEIYTHISRGCPPFCIQPMQVLPGVETVGELEVLSYLHRIESGDTSVMVIDSRTPEWILRGTIPGSRNIPWNKINMDNMGTFPIETETQYLQHILQDDFGAEPNDQGWDFSRAKTLVLFCNGLWCPQSASNIKTLAKMGYPVHKLKWYRGGMQDWVSAGLTTVQQR